MARQRKFEWGRYFFEFLSIFIGVSLAFAMTKCNEDRRDNQSASKILIEIQNGLKQDIDDINLNVNGHKQGIKAIQYLRRMIINQESTSDSFAFYYKRLLFRDFISIQNKSGYESLKSKGLELVHDDSLRTKIITVYDFAYEMLEKIEEEYHENQFHKSYFHITNEILAPYLVFDTLGTLSSIKPLTSLSKIEKK